MTFAHQAKCRQAEGPASRCSSTVSLARADRGNCGAYQGRPNLMTRGESARLLFLLHQEIFRRMFLAIGAAQHGHRGSLLTRAAISRRRTVAIEFGMCRSAR